MGFKPHELEQMKLKYNFPTMEERFLKEDSEEAEILEID